MSEITKPTIEPTSKEGEKTDIELQQSATARQEFLVAVGNMSWQLAVVVLIPTVGGFKLDQHLNSAPLWTIIGFVLAVVGMAVVVRRQLQAFSPKVTQADIDIAKKIRDQEDIE